MSANVSNAAAALLDLLLPRHCIVCEQPVERGSVSPACGACWARLPTLRWPQCERCGQPLVVRDVPAPAAPGPRRCRWCDQLPAYVRAVRSVCWAPDEPAGSLVHAFKYDGWTALADDMARRMAAVAWPHDVVPERAALVPVPLAAERARERGYNQSALLADALARRWDVSVWHDVLARQRATETQTRLTPGERLRNVAGAFGLRAGARERLRGTHVVLVDDVVTTGATLNACAASLLAGGARIVSYVTFGRARS